MVNCPNHEHDIEIITNTDVLGRSVAVRVCRRCGETCGTLNMPGPERPDDLSVTDPMAMTDIFNRIYAERQGWSKNSKIR